MPDACGLTSVTMVLFKGFELLDVFGPVELIFMAPGDEVRYVGSKAGNAVTSSQGARVVENLAYDEVNQGPGQPSCARR